MMVDYRSGNYNVDFSRIYWLRQTAIAKHGMRYRLPLINEFDRIISIYHMGAALGKCHWHFPDSLTIEGFLSD